jgi:hypothetical protein
MSVSTRSTRIRKRPTKRLAAPGDIWRDILSQCQKLARIFVLLMSKERRTVHVTVLGLEVADLPFTERRENTMRRRYQEYRTWMPGSR